VKEFAVYSPRKVTPQNRKYLPQKYNPEERSTYVLITLDEDEISTAIRNYIRAQMPVKADDEMPVVLTAGRGENGHSAAIVIEPIPFNVISPQQPAASMVGFEEPNAQALERNAGSAKAEAKVAVDISTDTTKGVLEETDAPAETKEETQAEVQEEAPAAEAKPAKRSSLFGDSKPVEETVAQDTTAEPAPTKLKGKSIFDNLA
jgi:hypothetical protein